MVGGRVLGTGDTVMADDISMQGTHSLVWENMRQPDIGILCGKR